LAWPEDLTRHLFAGALAAAFVVAVVKRRRAGIVVPWELVVLAGSSLVGFAAAQALAFQLYLPHRVVQHTLPYVAIVAIPLVYRALGQALGLSARRATTFALAAGVLPVFVLCGDGIAQGGYRDHRDDAPLYEWLEQRTDPRAQFAGTLEVLDEIPLFAGRQPYVNWMMAHPFRKGYYSEIDRRMRAMFDAYYAASLDVVVAFCDREAVDYVIVDRAAFARVPAGHGNSELYAPLGEAVEALWSARRPGGFALDPPPPAAVVFAHGKHVVVERERLRAAARAARGAP